MIEGASDTGVYGFFLGAAPGIIYTLHNGLRVRRTLIEAVAIAREQGEFLDMYSSENQNFMAMAHSGN